MTGEGAGPPAAPGLPPRYEVQRFLGQGAMGRVFLCRDQELDVLVAVKVLSPQFAEDPSSVDLVRSEARAVAKFRGCPSVLSLYGFERHEGSWYLITEYAAGGSLDQRLKGEGALPEAECRRLGAEVAEALHFAHQGRILHRDIKPGNVLLDEQGRAKVADFGIAKVLQADTAQASTMTLTGTPVYMSPEAILRTPMDARSDLYSLGCMLYEMGTGARPFSGSHFDIFLTKTAEGAKPPDPRAIAPHLSGEFCALVRRAMATSPEDRFPDGRAMAAALRGVSEEEEQKTLVSMAKAGGIPTPPATPTTPPPRDGATRREAPLAPTILTPPSTLPPQAPTPPAPPPPSRSVPVVPIVLGGVLLLAAAGVGGFLLLSGKGGEGEEKKAPPADPNGPGEDGSKVVPPPPTPPVKSPEPAPAPNTEPKGSDPKPPEQKPEPSSAPPPAESAISPAVDLPASFNAAPVEAAVLPSGFVLEKGRVYCAKDRAEMVFVPAGKFQRGYESGEPDEKPVREIHLKAFLIDRHEVTVGQWRAFCEANRKPTLGLPAEDDWPVVNVFHGEAVEYARWAGKRLPTEAEWERAARGTAGWSWPWGNEGDEVAAHAGKGNVPVPVGTFSRDESPCGAMDMAGNVSEWCADWYDPGYYGKSPEGDPQGPAKAVEGFGRCIRGGSFAVPATYGLTFRRGYAKTDKDSKRFGPSGRDYKQTELGFRCAAYLEEAPK